MDGSKFDALTRALGSRATRRSSLAGALGALLGVGAGEALAANGGRRGKRRKRGAERPEAAPRGGCNPPCDGGFTCVNGVCACESMVFCGNGSLGCCKAGEVCGPGGCAPCGSVLCNGQCCPATATCVNGACQTCETGTICKGRCCAEHQRCGKRGCKACRSKVGCGGVCCLEGEECTCGICTCPTGVTCGGVCCGEDQRCVNGVCTACVDSVFCTDVCCQPGEECVNGACACESGLTCNGACCGQDQWCSGGACTDCAGPVCDGACCGERQECIAGQCVTLGACPSPTVVPGEDPAANGMALQAAIDAAADGAVIELPEGEYAAPERPGHFLLTRSVTIRRCGEGTVELGIGAGGSRTLAIRPTGANATVVLERLTIGRGSVVSDRLAGGGVEVKADQPGFRLAMTDVEIDGGQWTFAPAPVLGGCLHVDAGASGEVTLTRTKIDGGSVGNGRGGGIYVASGALAMAGCEVTGNSVANEVAGVRAATGGGLYVAGGAIDIRDSKIEGNSVEISGIGLDPTQARGGGLYVAGGSVRIADTGVLESEATGDGAGMYLENGSVTLAGGAFFNRNVAGKPREPEKPEEFTPARGGAIFVAGGELTIERGASIGSTHVPDVNIAHGDFGGGGISRSGGTVVAVEPQTLQNALKRNRNDCCAAGACCNGMSEGAACPIP